jgi:putative salt-induced outer membrane protein
MKTTNKTMTCLCFAGVFLAAGPALAQDPPSGTGGQAAATSGATEVDGQGKFGSVADPTVEEEGETDATEFSLAAGGILSTGNAQSAAATASTSFRLRRDIHQATVLGAGNYGASAVTEDEWEQTVGNVQGRARYDVFFAKRFSAFLMATARHDPFQGLDLRLNIDPGVAAYALPKEENKLWFELGYDLQVDLRTEEAIVAVDADGEPILDMDGETIQIEDPVFINHAVRAFAGYQNRMSDKVGFNTGFEFLQSVIDVNVFRFVWDVALTVTLTDRFALSTTFTLRYENQPLPDTKKLDTITAINLVLRLL